MSKLFMPVILGTARQGRESEKVAKFILQETKEFGFETELIDVKDFPSSITNGIQDAVREKLSATLKKANGFIIVAPEYNHGYPGELKMFLDNFYEEYFYKPLGICGVSASPLGGARMIEQLRLVSIELHMTPIREAVYFSSVQNLFDEAGNIKDATYFERVKTMLKELETLANKLK